MKNNLKLRLVAVLLCLAMLFTTACTAQTAPAATTATPTTIPATTVPTTTAPSSLPENGAEKIVQETVTLYITNEVSQPFPVAHYESTPEIFLIDMNTAYAEFFASMLNNKGVFTYEETETTLTIHRDNGAFCVLDFVEDTITFNNYDLFCASRTNNLADMLSLPYVDEEGNSIYFSVTDSSYIAGLSICIDLADRDIPMDIYEGKKYIPFQTFIDLFLAPYGYNFTSNSKNLFLATSGSLHEALVEEYYSFAACERSQALAEFTANELCLLLDLSYGLQDEHGVLVGFETFFKYTGLWDDLISTDPAKSSAAIASLTMGFLADRHSGLNAASPYSGGSTLDADLIKKASSLLNSFDYTDNIIAARAQAMPEGVSGYLEVGNTAYVTFDEFSISPIRAQGYSDASRELVDTFGLVIYAHSMITREDSPIENVVLDLSCNVGGAFDAAVYVVAWMLGYADLHITNPITNSFGTVNYKADVNLDGVFDEKDSIADKNLFCLISPASFSCGNLVPALLKESGKVTLLGDTSGGGACAVQFASAADGTLFQFSSSSRMSVVSNGSYYTIDRGIEPHHHFSKFESYFNREALTDFLNNLM